MPEARATTEKPSAEKTYICNWRVKCDGKRGEPGSEIRLTDEQAKSLGNAVISKTAVEAQVKADEALAKAKAELSD